MGLRAAFERLDPKYFPAFLAAARAENFTAAGKLAAMTQSGISQHISKLEQQLGTSLFQRKASKVSLTDAGRILRSFVDHYLEDIDELFKDLELENKQLSGPVRYAMPESCLFAPHFQQMLKERASEFPLIQISVRIHDNQQILHALANGDVDFGFVTHSFESNQFVFHKFCQEEYILVGKGLDTLATLDEKAIQQLPFISWDGVEDCFAIWLEKHFPQADSLSFSSLEKIGHVDSLFGVVTMLQAGVGVTVLAKQCTSDLIESNELPYYRNADANAQHDVFIVTSNQEYQATRVKRVIESFLTMHP